jgi:hypothetical protein
MMPMAVLILAGELWLMKRLVIPDPVPSPAMAHCSHSGTATTDGGHGKALASPTEGSTGG